MCGTAATGCGSGSSDANETEAGKTFLKKGAKNTIPKFGEEASSDERDAASEVLEENFEARAAGEWAKQCESLTKKQLDEIDKESILGPKGTCVEDIERQALPLTASKGVRENTMTGPIDALRVKDSRAWALYHGVKGKDYAMPMKKEGDEWKVDSLTTTELP